MHTFVTTCIILLSDLPLEQVGPSNPDPVQSQSKVPGVLLQVPELHGVPVAHSFISETEINMTGVIN